MSTKRSIKHGPEGEGEVGFHLYEDALAWLGDEGEPPVFLELRGVQAAIETCAGGALVTVEIPRKTARLLGLLAENGGKNV